MRRHLSPSLVISLLALFVALGGTGYAVTKLPKNSVGAAQIKKNAVTSAKVKDGSLLSADFKSGQLPRGAAGPKGDTGPPAGRFPFSTAGKLFSGAGTINFSDTDLITKALALSGTGTLFANASINVFASSGANRAACRLYVVDGTGTEVGASQQAFATIADTNDAQIPLTMAVPITAPGSYEVRVACRRQFGGGNLFAEGYDVNGFLIAS